MAESSQCRSWQGSDVLQKACLSSLCKVVILNCHPSRAGALDHMFDSEVPWALIISTKFAI